VAEDRSRRVRTFNARRGRLTAVERAEFEALRPGLSLPTGPVDARSVFGREAPLVLEVGSGFGQAARAYALAHPEHDVVAVDVHTEGLAHLVATVARRGPPNLRIVEGDAVELLAERLAPGCLTAIHVFFPDPWPKRAHHGRRFVRPDVIDLVVDRLTPRGSVLFATDDPSYATEAQEVLDARSELHGGVTDRPPWRPRAGYEAKALAAGRPVVHLRYTREAASPEPET
jgi:tRNA (guanine-N7-)-methyltransferase